MRSKNLLPPIFAGLLFCIAGCTSPARMISYNADIHKDLQDSTHTAVYIPLNSIEAHFINNGIKKIRDDSTKAFFIEVVNGLAYYELTRKFKTNQLPTDFNSKEFDKIRWSLLTSDTNNISPIKQLIIETTQRCSCDLVIIPYSCAVRKITTKPKSWRGGKAGSYEKPVTFTAEAELHMQVWNKEGKLLYEKIGKGSAGRPLFYSMFKADVSKTDAVSAARRFFGPPSVKALNEAIGKAMRLE